MTEMDTLALVALMETNEIVWSFARITFVPPTDPRFLCVHM